METTTIGNLTIHRFVPWERVPEHLSSKSPGRLFMGEIGTDERILATIECMKLYDDEQGAAVAAATHTVIVRRVMPFDVPGVSLMNPLKACVMKKERSIKARQAAISAGVAPSDTPLVGTPVPTKVLAPELV